MFLCLSHRTLSDFTYSYTELYIFFLFLFAVFTFTLRERAREWMIRRYRRLFFIAFLAINCSKSLSFRPDLNALLKWLWNGNARLYHIVQCVWNDLEYGMRQPRCANAVDVRWCRTIRVPACVYVCASWFMVSSDQAHFFHFWQRHCTMCVVLLMCVLMWLTKWKHKNVNFNTMAWKSIGLHYVAMIVMQFRIVETIFSDHLRTMSILFNRE